MKILIFSTAYLPLIGGAEIAMKEITQRLADDFTFDLICARIKKELPVYEKIGNVGVYRAGWGWGKIDKFLLPWRGFKLAQKLNGQKKYEVVWAIMASFGGLAALLFKTQYLGVPYLLTLQEGDTPEHIHSRARWLGPYYKRIFERADFITTISQYLKDYAIKQGAKCSIEVVPNGVDVEKFKIKNEKFKINELKQKSGIKEDEKIIITVSRLVEKNGIGDLIEAISQLQITNYKLLILGSGPLEKSLKLQVSSYKLQNKVLFLGDISHNEVPKYLAVSDVFVRPSLSEGLGNSFLEAMAAGVPVIGTPVGGIPDFLFDPQKNPDRPPTGLFCEVRNPKSIAEKIKILLENSELRQKIIQNAKELVEQNYDWDLIARKMKNIFSRITINSR
jgi:glycosyltransferase involved in cell wall biosynthesis